MPSGSVTALRSTARASGQLTYFTGKPCNRGHIAARYVSAGRCVVCAAETAAENWVKPSFRKARASYVKDYRKRPKSQALCRLRRGLPAPIRECPYLCELCQKRKAKALDHDHCTGKFRGWLCGRCNTSLGVFGDSIPGLAKVLQYLVDAL